MKKGIDVSKWDVNFDWSKYIFDFVYIKVSEGSVIDPLFDYHWNGARGKTQRGAYHFFRGWIDPKLAVQRMIEFFDGDMGELPPALDLEDRDDVDKKTYVSRALTWLVMCEELTGIKPIVYTSSGHINEIDLHLYPDFADYDLWIASYPRDTIYTGYTEADRTVMLNNILNGIVTLPKPIAVKPFKIIKYHQWTAKLSPFDVPGAYTGTGYKKAVDCNFELESETTMPDILQEGTVIVVDPWLNIRDAPSTAGRDLGNLYTGDKVIGIVSNGWMRFTKIIRANGVIEMFTGYCSATFLTLIVIPDPTPTEPTMTYPESVMLNYANGVRKEYVPKFPANE